MYFCGKCERGYIKELYIACPCFQADKSVETEGSFKTIRVKLKQPLSQDTIENYFENKRKSGGGDIESCTITKGNKEEVQEALITFLASTGNIKFLYFLIKYRK